MTNFPKVTVAVPLYRSARFFEIVTQTLRGFEYPNLEIIVSDRHQADDSIQRLRELFDEDPRFRFLAAKDELDWVAHYNLLLAQASGEYLVWVSHDDSYSANFIRELVETLEKNPDAVLAYARVQRIDMNGKPVKHVRARVAGAVRSPGPLTAYQVALSGGMQFHGMFRRRWLTDRRLWIRPTVSNIAADMLWIFTLAMLGRMVYADKALFIKRYYATSTHKTWGGIMQGRYIWNFARVARSYADDFVTQPVRRVFATCVIYGACGLWRIKNLVSARKPETTAV